MRHARGLGPALTQIHAHTHIHSYRALRMRSLPRHGTYVVLSAAAQVMPESFSATSASLAGSTAASRLCLARRERVRRATGVQPRSLGHVLGGGAGAASVAAGAAVAATALRLAALPLEGGLACFRGLSGVPGAAALSRAAYLVGLVCSASQAASAAAPTGRPCKARATAQASPAAPPSASTGPAAAAVAAPTAGSQAGRGRGRFAARPAVEAVPCEAVDPTFAELDDPSESFLLSCCWLRLAARHDRSDP